MKKNAPNCSAPDIQRVLVRIEFDGGYEAIAVDALAKRDAAKKRISQEIVYFVGVEGAAEYIGQEQIAGWDIQILVFVVYDIGHPHRIDAQLFFENLIYTAVFVLDYAAGALFVEDKK